MSYKEIIELVPNLAMLFVLIVALLVFELPKPKLPKDLRRWIS